MVKIVKTVEEWKGTLNKLEDRDSIGFVPTMGALHSGHKSLMKKSIEANKTTLVSIFVNPTQFNDSDDLKNYPRVIENDIDILNELDVDYLFLPDEKELYPNGYTYRVNENNFSRKLCGAHRPGHFDAVLSVVMKLLNIIEPTRAYFGEKDWQQFKLIDGMVEAFFLKTKIIPCPIIREFDGLALSSRNVLLSEKHRAIAPEFNRVLMSGKSIDDMKSELINLGFKVDYIERYENRILGAVILGKVRLIDNVKG
jgi:pantoate--beta-alanine ligase